MTHVLVTGASGLLGSNVVREAERVFDVTAVVHEHPIEFDNAEVKQADLTDVAQTNTLITTTKPDWVIHCAAETALDELESAPQRAKLVNVELTRNVAHACANVDAQMLYVSTDSVFSGDDGPYSETDRPEPKNVYAQSKLGGEETAAAQLPDCLIVRTNLFGWSPGKKRSLAEWFYQNLRMGVSVPGFTDVFFSPVYAPELAQIFFRMLQADYRGLYHVPGADCVSKFEFGVRLALTFGFDQELIQPAKAEQIDWEAERPKRTCLDGSKLADELGLELPDLGDGMTHLRADLEKGLFPLEDMHSMGGTDA